MPIRVNPHPVATQPAATSPSVVRLIISSGTPEYCPTGRNSAPIGANSVSAITRCTWMMTIWRGFPVPDVASATMKERCPGNELRYAVPGSNAKNRRST